MENTGELTAHLTSGAVAVYLIEWLKSKQWFPFLTADTKTLNRLISAVTAFVAAVGIGFNYDAGAGQLVITGLTWSTILIGGWEWAKQFVLQQVLYDSVVQKAGVPKTVNTGTSIVTGMGKP